MQKLLKELIMINNKKKTIKIIFNLNGRTKFDTNSGKRHLQGYYIDRDEIISKLNFINNIKV